MNHFDLKRKRSQGNLDKIMNHGKMKRYLITFFKICIACILIWYLFKSGRLRNESLFRLFHLESLPFLVLSAFAFFSSQVLSSVRIIFLLKSIEIKLRFIQSFQLTMIGNFFNMVIPGTVGGDIVKGFYLARNEEAYKGRSSGIVIIDRVIGLLALLLIGVVSTFYLSKKYRSILIPYQYELWSIIAISAVGLGLFISFIFLGKNKWVRKKLNEIAFRVFRHGFFYNMIEGFGAVTKKRRYLIYAFLMSIVVQGISLAGLLNLVNLTGEVMPDMIALVAISSIVMLLGVIPVTPGNIGWTELLATFGWSAVGSRGGAEIFLSWRIITVICSLLGGIFYLFPVLNRKNVTAENDKGKKKLGFVKGTGGF
jgi:glycosyltransferase 2 family protein